ncbi:MAG: hypothetical protein ABUK20_02505 [Anaerolineales bacterium]
MSTKPQDTFLLCAVENQTGEPIFLANVIVQRLWKKGQVIAV